MKNRKKSRQPWSISEWSKLQITHNFDSDFAHCHCYTHNASHATGTIDIPCTTVTIIKKGSWHYIRCHECGLEWHEKVYQTAGHKRRLYTDKQIVRERPEWP